jgi:hypothetical protein
LASDTCALSAKMDIISVNSVKRIVNMNMPSLSSENPMKRFLTLKKFSKE